MSRSTRVAPVILLIIGLPFLFARLYLPLLDPDEGLYASIAQEMLSHGDWVIPHVNGLPVSRETTALLLALRRARGATRGACARHGRRQRALRAQGLHRPALRVLFHAHIKRGARPAAPMRLISEAF